MKVKIVTIAIGLSLAISAARGTPVLNIFEAGEQLFVSFNGSKPSFATIMPIIPPCGGCGEEWNIDFSSGWTLNLDAFNHFGLFIELGEPEGGVDSNGHPFENFIRPENELTLNWQSEHTGLATPGLVVTFPGGLIDPNGNKFDVVVADVPESGFTLSLLGIGLAGLAWFARFRRRVKDCRF
jgi:hypothetical protein